MSQSNDVDVDKYCAIDGTNPTALLVVDPDGIPIGTYQWPMLVVHARCCRAELDRRQRENITNVSIGPAGFSDGDKRRYWSREDILRILTIAETDYDYIHATISSLEVGEPGITADQIAEMHRMLMAIPDDDGAKK